MGFGLYMDIKMYIKKYFILSVMLYMYDVCKYLVMQDFCPQNMIASHISTSYQPNGSGNIHPLSKPIQNITSGSKLDSKLVPFFFFPYTYKGERKKAFSSSLFTFILATLLLYIVTAASIANEAKSESIVREGLKPLLFDKRANTVNGINP